MGCQCYQIGGPFIAEDPDCPAHGRDGYEARFDRLESQLSVMREALSEILRVHANDDQRPRAFYIAAAAIQKVDR